MSFFVQKKRGAGAPLFSYAFLND